MEKLISLLFYDFCASGWSGRKIVNFIFVAVHD
jgi:hypothetical protein